VASDTIARFEPPLGPGLLGDKAHSMLFDNAKIRGLAPEFRTTVTFDEGARQLVAHANAHPDLQRADPHLEEVFDRIVGYAGSAS
jgi:hypothetical protein